MKRTIFLLILLLSVFMSKAQINFEHEYALPFPQENLLLTNIGNNNYKYLIIDYFNSEINLYNLDHSPFLMNVSVPLISTTSIYDIGFVTSSLFDCDSTTIEYAIMTVGPDPTKSFYIYRTDGTLIFQRDSVTLPYCYGCANGGSDVKGIVNTSFGTKMLLFNSDNQYFIYGLCGTLPSQVISEETPYNSSVKIFPNPASKEIKFEIKPSQNLANGEFSIYNSLNKLIKTIPVSKYKSSYVLNVDSLSEGIYFYSFRINNKLIQSGKFIVTH